MKTFLKKRTSMIRRHFLFFSVMIFIAFSPVLAFTQNIEKKGHSRTSFPIKEKKTSKKPYSRSSLLRGKSSRGFTRMGLILTDPFSDLPLVHNYWVEQWIQAFQIRYAKRFRIWLERSYCYIPMMKKIFKNYARILHS